MPPLLLLLQDSEGNTLLHAMAKNISALLADRRQHRQEKISALENLHAALLQLAVDASIDRRWAPLATVQHTSELVVAAAERSYPTLLAKSRA